MRISDLSSDVCSSDLSSERTSPWKRKERETRWAEHTSHPSQEKQRDVHRPGPRAVAATKRAHTHAHARTHSHAAKTFQKSHNRSEESSAGKECVRTCRTRRSQEH